MAEEVKNAKKVYTLEEIVFNPENLTMSVISCIPFVGLVLMFVEKKDLFVRYHATQFAFLNLLVFIGWIPFIGWILYLVGLALFIVALMKTSKGERFDVPVLSDLALKVMSAIG